MIVLQNKPDAPLMALEAMTDAMADALGVQFSAIEPWSRYPFSAAQLSAYLRANEPAAPRYALTIDGVLAGAIGVRANWLRGPYLQFLGILPGLQGKGSGQLLLAWFEGAARARQERNIWVAASDFNSAAIGFYEHHGFQRAARFDGLVQDGITEILLRKRLSIKK